MTLADRCAMDIRELHEFFVEWYAGDRDDPERLERALAGDFEIIVPSGATVPRDELVAGIRDDHGQYADADPAFEIDIENIRHRWSSDDTCLLTYEEHQAGGDRPETVRVSSALFRTTDATSNGVEWVHLQETWLDGPE
jgi:hypothetical protein